MKGLFLQVAVSILFIKGFSIPLEPGQPGKPWSQEEISIVRAKVIRMMHCQEEASFHNPHEPIPCWGDPNLPDNLDDTSELAKYTKDLEDFGPHDEKIPPEISKNGIRNKWKRRGPGHTRLIQLAFHDCLRYEDGTGGCDGCLNWSGMGYSARKAFPNIVGKKPELVHAFPQTKQTTNNKLGMSARSLELIYTLADWPPGAPSLSESLRESGKSRADLWQFAGNLALEKAVNLTNPNCEISSFDKSQEDPNLEQQITAIEGRDKCEFRQTRPVHLKFGRIDCIPDEEDKWTHYPFEATKKEKHSNTYGTGTQVIKDLKRDFNMTAAETISLMALHGLNTHTKNYEEAFKYKWFGGIRTDNTSNPNGKIVNLAKGTFSNMYYKLLNGKVYATDRMIGVSSYDYYRGDKSGNPVGGTGWAVSCAAMWNNTHDRLRSGPCRFRPSFPGCHVAPDSDLQLREFCFDQNRNRKSLPGCETAELVERNGKTVQVGGPPIPWQSTCQTTDNFFATPFEVSFAINFTTIDNAPRGCGPLDGEWIKEYAKPDCKPYCNDTIARPPSIYVGSPGYDGSPACSKNEYAPEGKASADIVTEFAENHDIWQETFWDAWEKMQMNGYDNLFIGPNDWHLKNYT